LFESVANAYIQQSTYWAEVIQGIGPDRPIFLLCVDADGRDIAGLPLYVYEHALGNVLTSVPQAGPMGGVFYHESLSEEKIQELYTALLKCAEEVAHEYHCLSMSLISNPFQPDIERYKTVLKPTYIFENFTQSIPVNDTVCGGKIILKDYQRRSNLSRNVKKSHEAGFTLEQTGSMQALEAWYPYHVERHTEIGAKPLNLDLFRNILNVLSPRKKAHLLLVKKDAQIASGCIYIYHRNVLDVFLLSVNTQFLDAAPNFYNTEQSLLWAGSQGIHQYNWQSSPRRGTGVFRYKEQWGSLDLPYYFITKRFCSAERLREIGLENVKSEYPYHYVVPYGVFPDNFEQRNFSKG
jgi:hypothetical protein